MPGVSRRYRLSPGARADLEHIWLYTAERWSIDQADRYHNLLMDGIESLVGAMHRGIAIDHIRPGYRRLNAESHVIFYRPAEDGIEIVRILHSRMDFDRHL
jgi:toxin ParE1/3/4